MATCGLRLEQEEELHGHAVARGEALRLADRVLERKQALGNSAAVAFACPRHVRAWPGCAASEPRSGSLAVKELRAHPAASLNAAFESRMRTDAA